MDDFLTSLTLLKLAQSNDQESWNRLVSLYTPLVEHWCRTWGVARADIEDIRQDVFQVVARALTGFHRDRPGDTFRGWIRTITRRKVLDHFRRREHQPVCLGGSGVYERLQQIPEAGAGEEDSPVERQVLLRRALEMVRNEFEERTWQAFWRSTVEGRASSDVGAEMGMSRDAVRQARSRILRTLKAQLGDLLR